LQQIKIYKSGVAVNGITYVTNVIKIGSTILELKHTDITITVAAIFL